jgi:predicted type IV restriction endonuclease
MQQLIERIRERLTQGAYANEAAISHGIVTPILNALGWDSADPHQLVPEFSVQRGRIDFALFGLGHRPSVFIEVKGIGRAGVDGDRQLFEYAFHHGVPLCVLTDGREWSFYVPSGQGSYEDRRVYRLQLDDRDADECERVLIRYLARGRVRDGSAFEDAQRDYRDAAGRREAAATLPRAWADLLDEAEELLLDIVVDKAEALCGYKPSTSDVVAFLRRLKPSETTTSDRSRRTAATVPPNMPTTGEVVTAPATDASVAATSDNPIAFTIFGQPRTVPTASLALIETLKAIAAHDPAPIESLAAAIRGRTRNLVARSVAEINPARPDLARAAEFAPGWLIGLNISNREKMAIIRTACDVFGLRMPEDIDIRLPNAP